MEEANVPVIKGYHGDVQDDATLLVESKKIGFPVMLKAIMGGGGKGICWYFVISPHLAYVLSEIRVSSQ